MTKEQFEKAKELSHQIGSLTPLLDHLERTKEFRLEPMTRQSGIYLRFGIHEGDPIIQLTEGEALCIRDALESYGNILTHEFERL